MSPSFTVAERQILINTLAALPEQLAASIADLSEAQLDTLTNADIWTIRQLVHHVADSHLNMFTRVKLLLTEENPTIRPYNQDAWALLADTRSMPVEASLQILRGLHARLVHLYTSLDESQWLRTGIHPESGPISINSLLQSYAHHGRDHIEQIGRIREELLV